MLACVRSAAVFGIDAAPVNIEVDVMAKHVEKLLNAHLPGAAP